MSAENELKEQRQIRDRSGRIYRVELSRSSPSFRFTACAGKCRIAWAWCLTTEADLKLGDFVVNDIVPVPLSPLRRFLLRALRRTHPTMSYRKRGIGTALLRLVIVEATTRGFRSLFGDVTQSDLPANPNLLNWYRGHGFSVESIDDARVAAKITRPLR